MIDDFESEFSESNALSKALIISQHATSINDKAEEFLKKSCDYLTRYKQQLSETYQEEKNAIQHFVETYFKDDDKLILFINMPEKINYFEELVQIKLVKILQENTLRLNNYILLNKGNLSSEAEDFTTEFQAFVGSQKQKPYYEIANQLDALIAKGSEFLLIVKEEPLG
ncbi:hypothetical protein F8M41_020228 [Gigaspora margarita]|uniref:Uncharacterized protein n=1 Tax=Gigaspora margarita TaxID=4874 RepID=A0A8H4AIU9_GIGMA|nr:hypothetical protein F8M41_020228 [Gigaspora margarita]